MRREDRELYKFLPYEDKQIAFFRVDKEDDDDPLILVPAFLVKDGRILCGERTLALYWPSYRGTKTTSRIDEETYPGITRWLVKNKFGHVIPGGLYLASSEFPLFEFNMDNLKPHILSNDIETD